MILFAKSPEHRVVPHGCHPRQGIWGGGLQRETIRAESLKSCQRSRSKKQINAEQPTQRTGQKNASAMLNFPNKNPSSSSPRLARRCLVALRASSQIARSRSISFRASSDIGTLPVYRARKFVWNVLRTAEKPECIWAAALRARARSLRSRGQRSSSGCDSARNSQIASESPIGTESKERHSRTGTSPVGETVLAYGICENLAGKPLADTTAR